MTNRFAPASFFGAKQGAFCGASFASGTTHRLVMILGIAPAVSIIICGIIGIVRLIISLACLLVLVRSLPCRLRTAA